MTESVKTDYTFELPKGYVDDKGEVHREVTIREITGADQEAMLSQQLRNNPAKMLTALLSRVITKLGTIEGKQVDSRVTASMYKSDRDFLIMKLKEIDSGPDMEIDVECPDCGRKFKAMLDISDFFTQ